MGLSNLVDALLVLEQHLHGLHVLLVDGVQQRVPGLHLKKKLKSEVWGYVYRKLIEDRLRDPAFLLRLETEAISRNLSSVFFSQLCSSE